MSDHIAEIRIRRTGIETDLGGCLPESVRYLRIYSERKTADLEFLKAYPNLTQLFLKGTFANIDAVSAPTGLRSLTMHLSGAADFSNVRGLALKNLTASCPIDAGFSNLLAGSVESLELTAIRKLEDLSFLERASGLKKLFLCSLPAVETLPDFGKMPNLYGLKLYELHKLNDIDSLARSAIRYLIVSLAADKLPGTRLAKLLLDMEHLERADLSGLDRSGKRRWNVLKNQLKKAGKEDLLADTLDMTKWNLL